MGDRTLIIRDVFSRGMPTITYVDRINLGIEKELRNAISLGNVIIAITGPSKSGKTVLRKRVIPDELAVRIEGGQISEEADFWESIRDQLKLPNSLVSTDSTSQGTQTTGGATVSIPVLKVTGTAQANYSTNQTNNKTFSGPQKNAMLNTLIETRKFLVIDDFHYIKKEIRSAVVRALKSSVFDGLIVVILSVPYRAFDVLERRPC